MLHIYLTLPTNIFERRVEWAKLDLEVFESHKA